MIRLSGIVLAALAATTALAGDNATTTATSGSAVMVPAAMVGQQAPAFTLSDPAGKKVSLSDYKGKYVVLEWVNFDCPFVKKHYAPKSMQTTQAQWTKQGVIWLSICSSAMGKQGNFEGSALTDRIKAEAINSSSYLLDADGAVGMAYGAKTTPHMFVIAPDGKLIYTGAIDDKASADQADLAGATNYVVEALKASMAGKEVAVKSTQSYGCSVKYAAKK
jgi:AhpC/TSA family